MKQNITLIIIIVFVKFIYAQNNTNTPYSLFGLGVENKTATGGLTGLGNTGVSQSNPFEINIYNPASLGNLQTDSFLYEFGLNGMYSELKTNSNTEKVYNANLSHIAIAFPIKKNIGIGIGLLPYTKTGYNIDYISPIEGSTENFYTRVTGSGGLNKFYLATGFQILKKLRLGVDISFLFGNVQEESQLLLDSYVVITDENRYNGTRLETGFQYKLPTIKGVQATIGGTFELPSSLSGNQIRNSYKTSNGGSIITIDKDVENELDNFNLPLTFGLGITTEINNKITANLDYKHLMWDETNRKLNNETYINQSIYALGLEFLPSKNKFKYWSNVKYGFGLNYNTGFLNINSKNIDSYFISFGLGLPMKKNSFENFNLSYSYGKEGTLDNNLIQENLHKITLNLNFVGNWFVKRKVD